MWALMGENENTKNDRLKHVAAALERGTFYSVRNMLKLLHPAEIAHLLESLPHPKRELVWELVDPAIDGDVLIHVNDEVRASLIRDMDTHELVAAAGGLETDDLADILNDLPDVVIREVLQSMDDQDRLRLEAVLLYPDDSAGGLMNTDTVTVRPNVTLDVVQRYLRLRGSIPDFTDNLYVVDRNDHYLGQLPLTSLLMQPPGVTVSEVMLTESEAINADMKANEVARLFETRDLVSAPVTDEHQKLLGRITIDDIVDVIREQGDHSMMRMAGLDEEDDMFSPVMVSVRNRSFWLGINLLTALLASWVIGLFENTIDRVVALAVLMPIVASMGGVAGSQTLTLVIRGIALGKVGGTNARQLLLKELAVSICNGLIWAIVVAAVAVLWFGDYQIGTLIAVAIVVNLLCAAFAGATIPLLIRKLGADPALGGTVMLTTVTDVVGFMVFLGLATMFLL